MVDKTIVNIVVFISKYNQDLRPVVHRRFVFGKNAETPYGLIGYRFSRRKTYF